MLSIRQLFCSQEDHMIRDRQIGAEANPEVQRQRARQQDLLKPQNTACRAAYFD